ncbi:toll/interleukin-1 receptor domain-containing protein [Streptomyces sp. NPDC006465]|uniref:toll/interleukin-1 receptor domain-containing protein n=1 Tax=Streptomyces sp. NPDC006465 TaxID=3157174 RepID=UPI0033B59E93
MSDGKEGSKYAYDAFLSYSQEAGRKLAPALQRAVETFAKPWYRRRGLRVFRDSTHVQATSSLWGTIESALAVSSCFILMASPGAARSPWVNQEVEWWLQHRSASRLYIVLTEGELSWDPVQGEFDLHGCDALPPALLRAFPSQPWWVDLRGIRAERLTVRRDPAFLDRVASLVASLTGRPKDDLIGEELRQHRRTKRIAMAAAATVSVLAVTAMIAATVAVQQRDQARRAADVATARLLASSAGRDLADRLDLASLEAVAGHTLDPSSETRASLFQAAAASPLLERFVHADVRLTALAVTPDGSHAVVGGEDGSLRRVRLEDGSVTRLPGMKSEASDLRISTDGRHVAAWAYGQTPRIIDLAAGRVAEPGTASFPRRERPEADGFTGVFSANERYYVNVGDASTTRVQVHRVRDGRRVADLALPGDDGGTGWGLAVSGDGARVAVGNQTSVQVFSVRKGGTSVAGRLTGVPGARLLALDNGGRRLVTVTGQRLTVWDLGSRGRIVRSLARLPGPEDASFARSGVAGASTSRPFLWTDQGTSTTVARNGGRQKLAGSGPVFTDHARRVVTHVYTDDTATLLVWAWNGARYQQRARIPLPSHETKALAFARHEKEMLAVDTSQSQLTRIRLRDGEVLRRIRVPGLTPDSMGAVSGNGEYVACGHDNGSVTLVRVDDGDSVTLWRKNRRAVGAGIADIDMDYRGLTVSLVLMDGEAVVWDVPSRRPVRELHAGRFVKMVTLPAANVITGVRIDGTVELWEFDSGRSLGSLSVPVPDRSGWREPGTYLSVTEVPGARRMLVLAAARIELLSVDLREAAWRGAACELAGRRLGAAELEDIVGVRLRSKGLPCAI